jgi:hypothetical protein
MALDFLRVIDIAYLLQGDSNEYMLQWDHEGLSHIRCYPKSKGHGKVMPILFKIARLQACIWGKSN